MPDRALSTVLLALLVSCGGRIADGSGGSPGSAGTTHTGTSSGGGAGSGGSSFEGSREVAPGAAPSASATSGSATTGSATSGSASAASDGSEPPSCSASGPGMTNCGPAGAGSGSCCASPQVPAGAFDRNCGGSGSCEPMNSHTMVSGLRLDKYEITVGRFRQFVTASSRGWRPAPGSGKHSHLNGGRGLVNSADTTGASYEAGWESAWNANLATTSAGWDDNLSCNSLASWTPAPGPNESRPINCADWYEVYAFCIWDGGFLPSDAEWNYVASGGSEQRFFPWSAPPGSEQIDCTYANYGGGPNGLAGYCTPGGVNPVGSESPKGDGKWGQSDLGGNVWEWVLDASSGGGCVDCAALPSPASPSGSPDDSRVNRGGGLGAGFSLQVSSINDSPPTDRDIEHGARCARAP